ncbi:hypothetical protein ACFXEL_35220 [Streptomyces sp. NPDC059382]|uniref:hypothetical protein n=1 Tax=unclassified Streptomyces TaxID=2593676 RepID=UPI00331D5E63
MRIRKLLSAAAVAGTVLTAGLATAGTASAGTLGDCQGWTPAAVCLYYNSSSNSYGAVYHQQSSISDYSSVTFTEGAWGNAGAGTVVKNHAAAVDSYYGGTFTVYYNSGYNCSYACQNVPAYGTANLNSTMKNNNASGRFR